MEYYFWLCNIEEIGAVKIRRLLEFYGDAQGVWKASRDSLTESGALREREIDRLEASRANLDRLARQLEGLEGRGIRFLPAHAPDFPRRLHELPDCPAALYLRGRLPEEESRTAAIVGARECSNYGREMANHIAYLLAKAGVQIVSGLAAGIDSCGHKGALRAGGYTCGVLGNGVDICYPRENFRLYEQMIREGGVLSEFSPGSKPAAGHFPMRNRLISGLSDLVIVIEAREKSGSLITADLALEQGKDIFALPGRITDKLSRGCNRLISQGAAILHDPDELLEYLGVFCPKNEKNMKYTKKASIPLAPEEEKVYSCLGLQPSSLSEIVERTGLYMQEAVCILMKLEKSGLIKQTMKNYYAITYCKTR